MIQSLLQSPTVWERLQSATSPVYLYGMGNGAEKILAACRAYSIPIAGVFASDEYVRGHNFCGYRVERYSDAAERTDGEMIILPAFAVRTDDMIARLMHLAAEHTLYIPDVPVFGEGLFDRAFIEKHAAQIERVYGMLADDDSRELYLRTLEFKLTGDISLVPYITTPKSAAYELLELTDSEIYADLGAYTGDTVEEVMMAAGGIGSVVAIEPDRRNFKKLTATLERLGITQKSQCHNVGAWSGRGEAAFDIKGSRGAGVSRAADSVMPLDSLDNLLDGEHITLLKLDVEGSDLMALKGCERTIREHKPKLILSLYHRNEDVFALPLRGSEYRDDYKMYLGRHKYIPAWDFNLYCI